MTFHRLSIDLMGCVVSLNSDMLITLFLLRCQD
jgi:hypothetical protein